jgi:hypothetical protein
MLTESIPVKHKTNDTLGAGIIVGNEVFNSVDANGIVKTSLIFLVIWENHPTITPHPNSELTHLLPVEDWYQEYFSNLEDENNEHEFSDDEEEEEETENPDLPVVETFQVMTNDDALNDASSEFQE